MIATAGVTHAADPAGQQSTVALLDAERARSERRVNVIRLIILMLLGGAALIYAPHLTLELSLVNVSVLGPMLVWAIGQEILLHRQQRTAPALTFFNAAVDLSALTCLLLGYGLLGQADLAVKSPIWLAYFLILAARPFTGSARGAAFASGVAVVQYGALVAFFVMSGRLGILADPLATVAASGTSVFDEGTKLLLLALAGCVSTYATAWNDRTLERAVIALRASEARFRHQALHDPLTELGNRALFRERVERALLRHVNARDRVAVIFLDLDNFKTVNDSLGHREGDRLLSVVAARLLNATRGCDTVARLGGDEFAVLLENVRGEEDAVMVADRIAHALQAPVALEHRVVSVGASVGIARGRDTDGAEELLRNADVAMYTAKERGKGQHVIFVPAMHAAITDRLALEVDLRDALTRDEFCLVYQPIIDLSGNQITGVEALVRWDHPERGRIPPLAFIPIAEETGMIVPLGRWIIREACRQGAVWLSAPDGGWRRRTGFTVSVNLSGEQLAHPGLASDVADALRDSGFPANRLVLEITESVIMANSDTNLATLHALKALGVRLAIDDFGTGYSSLAYLQKFPVDILKIDKSFVDGIARSATDATLARTIIALGGTLALRTVAEGVQDADQCTLLRELGCDFAQGFHFARPLSAEEIDGLGRVVTPADGMPLIAKSA